MSKQERMKIGIVLYPTYGGSGVVATELGKELARRGHQVHFISYSMPVRLQHFHQNIVFHEVGVANYPLFDYPPYESALAGKIVDVVLFEQLDVLHVHYAIPHASAGYMAKQILNTKGADIPMVTTLHGTDITIVGKDASLKPVVEFSINKSDAVTTVSNSLREMTFENFEIKNKIEVIPNFIDVDRFASIKNEHFKALIAPNDELIILHTSNFRKVKRIEDIIYAFSKVSAQLSAKLILVGDGPERQRMELLCRELGVCQHIKFLGKQDAIGELLSVSDMFVLASERESFGLAALEALAAGVPIITSDAGGLPELNIHGETGFVYPVGDTDQLANYIIELGKDKNLRAKMATGAAARAKDFDTSTIVPIYEKIYDSVLSLNKQN